jgi:hypothetical protein
MVEEMPGFIPRALRREDVSLLNFQGKIDLHLEAIDLEFSGPLADPDPSPLVAASTGDERSGRHPP